MKIDDNILRVQMFGTFSMTWNGMPVTGRSKSRETQFAYLMQILLHSRASGVSRDRLEHILFEDRDIADIHHAMRSVIYNAKKKLRNAELKILQEQIKPHFLYNSLSGIAYLITDRQNTTACDMVISLSEYYRESLSKGSEVISLATEVNIVKNYLKLQKMRFCPCASLHTGAPHADRIAFCSVPAF